jgi:membrane protein DedA with SNARE-associated domain
MKELVHQYGAWLVFVLVFLESIGLPLPGEAILISAAIFAGTTQGISIALILLSGVLEPIRKVWIHDEWFAARRLSMMRIMARRTKAATVVA